MLQTLRSNQVIMMQSVYRAVLALVICAVLVAGCSEPPIKEPAVTITDIALSDISLQKMTVNTTVVIFNPNPVGAHLNKVVFDVWYLDGTPKYLGHGEQYAIEVRENGNTSVTIPVMIGNIQAFNALSSFADNGKLTLLVNGSAFVDVKVTSYEKKFEQTKEFDARDYEGILPLSSLSAGSVNVSEKIGQIKGLLSSVVGG
jgi:LEA14-like dessication related protein